MPPTEPPRPPELVVIVLGVGAPPELADAVASLKRQTVPVEIVVVNSGGGNPVFVLGDLASGVTIIALEERLWAGAARNVGIEASVAPWVAFLASDHIALENWAENRLALHKSGHPAVACAVINSHPRNVIAWAAHLAILVRRLPGVPPEEAGLYGVSYDRALFDRYGTFRNNLRIGEDTEFNERLTEDEKPVWAPQVITIHRTVTSLPALLSDQFARGRRYAVHWPRRRRRGIVPRTIDRFLMVACLGLRSVSGAELWMVAACLPVLFVAVFTHEYGVRAGIRERHAKLN